MYAPPPPPAQHLAPPSEPAIPQRGGTQKAALLGLLVGLLLGAGGMYLAVGDDSEATTPVTTVDQDQEPQEEEQEEPNERDCSVERRVIETAIEAYFADTGTDATTIAELSPTYLRDDLSAQWLMTPGSPPLITGTGICTGY